VTDSITDWLHAQLAEDERIARAAQRQHGGGEWSARADASGIVAVEGLPGHADELIPVVLHPDEDETAVHVAEHDPARVLREIDANRRRLERHTPELMVGYDSDADDPSTYVLGCPTCQVTVVKEGDFPCVELRDMLVSYADRPGYRPDWRP
jgi:hypothetical protein